MFSFLKNFFDELYKFRKFLKLNKEQKKVIFYAENENQLDFFEDTINSLLKRNIDIHDVGNSALYLISDLAGGVTGEIHYVDAGYNKVAMPDPKNIS